MTILITGGGVIGDNFVNVIYKAFHGHPEVKNPVIPIKVRQSILFLHAQSEHQLEATD